MTKTTEEAKQEKTGEEQAPPATSSEESQGGTREGSIPRERFDQVNERMKAAEARLQELTKGEPTPERKGSDESKPKGKDESDAGSTSHLDQRLAAIERDHQRRRIESELGASLTDDQFKLVTDLTKIGLRSDEALGIARNRNPEAFGAGRDTPQSIRPRGGSSPLREPPATPDPIDDLRKENLARPMGANERRDRIVASMKHRGIARRALGIRPSS